MELTLDQALIKGVEAHKAGKLVEADRYYTAILKAQPKHPDANHNMGVLAVGLGKLQESLPFFKTALETNPSIAQFWLSYIDALIKLNRIADAKVVFEEAKSKGVKGNSFEQIALRLNISSVAVKKEKQEIVPDQSNILDELKLHEALKLAKKKVKDGLSEEAKRIYKDILKKFPKNRKAIDGIKVSSKKAISKSSDDKEPPQDQLQSLITLCNQGKFQKALTQSSQLLKEFPNSINLYNIIGASNRGLGKLDEAIEAYNKIVFLKPDYALTYNNMGIVLQDQGKLEEAIQAFNKAISIKPDYAEAYNNVGNALVEQRKLDEAIKAYNKAISIKPDYAEAYNNAGIALVEQGKLDGAIEAYNKALSIKPDYAEAYYSIGNALNYLGKIDEAIEAFNKAISIKPDYATAKHMLSALTGNTNEIAPREYVENLFDGYSKKFETSLVGKLEYNIPKLIRDILIKPNNTETLGSVLDLGCGTGLLGSEIKNHCTKIEGIDLSNKMLALAKKKNVYDKLSQFDIVEYLTSMPLGFDYYVALDVFVYIGELTEIFRLIKSRNKKPGRLVFSTEHTEKDGFHLLGTARYSHSKSYIESLCKNCDYTISHFSTSELRKEKGDFLTGGIYILEFE